MGMLTQETAPLPHERLRGSGYGLVLVLILLSLGFQLGAPERDWARMLILILQSATLLAALHVSSVRPALMRGAMALTALAVLTAAGVLVGSGELGRLTTASVGLMLVVLAPLAIAHGIARHFRAVRRVTLTTMFAGLCIYLLVGMAFGFIFGIVGELQGKPFFANDITGNQSDFLYFSFATMTTTGYGDFVAATNIGRSVAITEALIGQIYLVTVVALIVGNLGRGGTIRD